MNFKYHNPNKRKKHNALKVAQNNGYGSITAYNNALQSGEIALSRLSELEKKDNTKGV